MRFLLLLLIFVIAKPNLLYSQSFNKQNDKVLAYNLAINSILGGIGGAINKKKDEKFSKAFLRNFLKGGLGGLVKYTAKYQTYYLNNERQLYYAPINRAVFFLGHSIAMNASMNEKSFENIYFNYFGINFKYSASAERGERFSSKLSGGTLVSSILFLTYGDKFNFNKSLEYGLIYFETNPEATHINGGPLNGRARFNSISVRVRNRRPVQSVVPHEILHTYQVYDFFALSSFYKTKEKALLDESKIYRFTSKYLELDYEPLFFTTIYLIQPQPRYYKNFFEYEAEHFSSRRYIDRD